MQIFTIFFESLWKEPITKSTMGRSMYAWWMPLTMSLENVHIFRVTFFIFCKLGWFTRLLFLPRYWVGVMATTRLFGRVKSLAIQLNNIVGVTSRVDGTFKLRCMSI